MGYLLGVRAGNRYGDLVRRMTDLFTYAAQQQAAAAARDAGIALADYNAPKDWKDDVLDAIVTVSRMRMTFTADDVWEWIETHGASDLDVNPAALGPVMLRAAREHLIEPTGAWVKTRNARRHRELKEWRRVWPS